MTVLYTNPPKNEPVAYIEHGEIVCAKHYTPEYLEHEKSTLTPVYAGEVAYHAAGNVCYDCGKTIL